jgi:peptidyl-prolyl cis-trans isomerase SurA
MPPQSGRNGRVFAASPVAAVSVVEALGGTIMTRALRVALGLAACGLALVLAPIAHAETSIKVIVNNEPITNYDIAQRAKLMQVTREKGGTKEATEQLINETLQMQEAKKRGFVIADKDIDGFFAQIAGRSKMTVAQFGQALASVGLTPNTLKRRIKAQATWAQLAKGKTRATAVVKATDITAEMLQKQEKSSMTMTEYKLQQIVFIVPDDKKSPSYMAQRKREAEAFRGRFSGCDKSIELAKSLKDVVVVNLGRRDTLQLEGPQGDDVKATGVGKTTRPNQTGRGVELIAVCEAREIHSDAAVRAEAESKLMLDQAEDVGADYLKDLRKAAVIVYR